MVLEELFEDDVFVVLTKDSKDDKNKLIDQITECGGIVARAINKKVTIVICDDRDAFQEDIKKAEELKLPIVKEAFVSDSISKVTKVNASDYLLPATSGASKKADNSDTSPPAKKQKTNADNSVIAKNSDWMGACVSKESGDAFPFVINIKERKGNDIEGTVSWPTLNNSLTKFRGSIDGDQINLEEYEAIRGEDEVELPNHYDGKLTDTQISGFLKDSNGEETNTFKADLVKKREPKAPDLPFLQPKAQFKGIYVEEFPFKLVVNQRADDGAVAGAVGGTICWTTLDNNTTKFKGIIKDNEVSLEEYEVIKGDLVEVPVKYEGNINGNAICGKFASSSANGVFDLELKADVK